MQMKGPLKWGRRWKGPRFHTGLSWCGAQSDMKMVLMMFLPEKVHECPATKLEIMNGHA